MYNSSINKKTFKTAAICINEENYEEKATVGFFEVNIRELTSLKGEMILKRERWKDPCILYGEENRSLINCDYRYTDMQQEEERETCRVS